MRVTARPGEVGERRVLVKTVPPLSFPFLFTPPSSFPLQSKPEGVRALPPRAALRKASASAAAAASHPPSSPAGREEESGVRGGEEEPAVRGCAGREDEPAAFGRAPPERAATSSNAAVQTDVVKRTVPPELAAIRRAHRRRRAELEQFLRNFSDAKFEIYTRTDGSVGIMRSDGRGADHDVRSTQNFQCRLVDE